MSKGNEEDSLENDEEEIFELNEDCIARDAGRLYEAKILKVHEVEEKEDFTDGTNTIDMKGERSIDKEKEFEMEFETESNAQATTTDGAPLENETKKEGKKKRFMKRYYFIHYTGWK